MKKILIDIGNYDANIYEIKTGDNTVWVPLIFIESDISEKLEEFGRDCSKKFRKEFNHQPEYLVIISNDTNCFGVLATDDEPSAQ